MHLRLKVRSLKAEVVETLLHGCMTWSPNKLDYDRFRRVYQSMLRRCSRSRKPKRDDRTLSYGDALAKSAFESIEAIVRKRRVLFAGFVARMRQERLLQMVMFGELVGGKGRSGGQEKDWMYHLKEDNIFEGWRKAAQKSGRWFSRVEEGAELFIRKWHETDRRKCAERRAKAEEAPSTVGISKPPGEGGRMGRRGGEGRRGEGARGGVVRGRLERGTGEGGASC